VPAAAGVSAAARVRGDVPAAATVPGKTGVPGAARGVWRALAALSSNASAARARAQL